MTQWTVKRETYERTIEHPDGTKATVFMRPLNAGDRAEFNEIRILADEGGSVQTGRIQLLMVERALVDWTLQDEHGDKLPISVDIIRQLEPRVFDQLYEHVSYGKPDIEKVQIDGLTVIDGDAASRSGEDDPLARTEHAAAAS